MGTRTARFGFALYAIATSLSLAVGAWNHHLMTQLGTSAVHAVELQLKLMQYSYWALDGLGIVALFAASRMPAAMRVRTLLLVSLGLAGLGFVLALGQTLFLQLHHGSYETLERWLKVENAIQAVVYAASEILLLLAALRIARSVPAEWLRATAIVAMVARAAMAVAWLTPLARHGWMLWLHRANHLVILVVCAGVAAVVSRVVDSAPDSSGASDGKLAEAWRAPADGIGLYLGGALARILLTMVSFAVMAGARGSQSLSELRDLRGGVLLLAALSAVAAVTMLVGLWRISRAPDEARASGAALIALTLGCLGLALDAWTTSITADALDGNLSAAFYAMDALPVITVVTAVLGVGLAVSLLRALENLATALSCPELAARARGAMGFVTGAGVLLAIGLALSRHTPEVVVAMAVIAVPMAIVAAVQFVRVALGVSRVIRERLA